MTDRYRRRTLLSLAAATMVSGCLGGESTGDPRTSTEPPTKTTETPMVEPDYDTRLGHDIESWSRYDPAWRAPTESPEIEVELETLVTGLEIPWDLSFAPNGDLFITERVGRVNRFAAGELEAVASPDDALDAEAVDQGSRERSWFLDGGEGGTMGTTVHPSYPDVPLVYVYYTYRHDREWYNKLVYVDVSADDPASHVKTLVDEIPANRFHNGGRIAFGPENYLWVTVGDAGQKERARDPSFLGGTVLRLTPEGEPAPGNPDHGGDPRVFTVGHRNPQCITWQPDGTPVITEHGPGPDEVSVLGPGNDYGWADARDPPAYRTTDGVTPPVASSLGNTWAPAGGVFYTADAVPAFRNRLVFGALGSQRLKVATLTPADDGDPTADLPPLGETGVRHDGDWTDGSWVATTHDLLVDEVGRIRHVEQGPDGALYLVTSNRDGRASGPFPTGNDDRLLRLTPA
ncbi:PQQ-dependent sugar dehydrogenase [Haloarchaeobius sp. TZWSO28]|uniref:PQQ-dependent sugar dehydrogenase n=1 Tax=Haloarchaeobius sp. TZWSO28 TaxID=3446119 RepID=UPI003EC0B563